MPISLEKNLPICRGRDTVRPDSASCDVLMRFLEDAEGKLAAAVSRMRELCDMARPDHFREAVREAQSLRMECQVIRAELKHHKQSSFRNQLHLHTKRTLPPDVKGFVVPVV